MKQFFGYFLAIILISVLIAGCSTIQNSSITNSSPSAKPVNTSISPQATPNITEHFLNLTGLDASKTQKLRIGQPISQLWVPVSEPTNATDEDYRTLYLFSGELNSITGKTIMPNRSSISKSYHHGNDILYFFPGESFNSQQKIDSYHTDYENMLKDFTDEDFYTTTIYRYTLNGTERIPFFMVFEPPPADLPMTIFVNSDLKGAEREYYTKNAILAHFGIVKILDFPLTEMDKEAIKILFSDKIKNDMTAEDILRISF